jgi:hypothetical protein
MYLRFRKLCCSAQCSPAGLGLALLLAVGTVVGATHYSGLLAALRITVALALASAALGLLAGVTVALSRRAARTAPSKPVRGPEPVSVVAAPAAPEPASVPLSGPVPLRLIRPDGSVLTLAEPGQFPARTGATS